MADKKTQQLKKKERTDTDQKKEKKGKPQKEQKPARVKDIVRFAETNIDGTKPVSQAITAVSGVSDMLANAILTISGFENKPFSQLSEADVAKLEDMALHPDKHNLPSWLLNRRRDPSSGQERHLVASQLQFTRNMDVNALKKQRCYRGIRHGAGLPVRGQRTRSSFRKGRAVGVKRVKGGKK
ncbi:MAG: 30S ribosomal protein S13 [Nanoarchaeota archaeon]|nr:30S ribosomal protein S13 [Nanoarchaeota archaeon]